LESPFTGIIYRVDDTVPEVFMQAWLKNVPDLLERYGI
jgi:hypothetical protein